LPITIGQLDVLTNETATEVFESHKGKFGLDKVAGQLLAALLNVWALDMGTNSSKTSCINATITFTNETLAAEGYDGDNGTPDPKYHPKNNPAPSGLKFNHTLLDRFNNFGCAGEPPLQVDP